jgi:DNA polymerase III sliding clamp (beta) subunit (PCNA family)
MPTDKTTSLVRYRDGLGREAIVRVREEQKAPKRDLLEELNVLPETMVVSDADKRFEAAMALTVEDPTDFIRGQRRSQPPLVKGARVTVGTVLGFLDAMSSLEMKNVKVSFLPGDEPKIFLEGSMGGLWAASAIRAESSLKNGFSALLPLKRGISVLNTLGSDRGVVIGVDKKGFCLGPHSVPFGGRVEDFPAGPSPLEPIARGALPVSCCHEIASRVTKATHPKTLFGSLHTLLMDFDVHELDGHGIVMGTVIATDGCRMHILQLPQMQMKIENGRLPPAMRIPPTFFSYLSSVVESKGAILEFRPDQIVAKGEDFMIHATATIEKQSEPTEIGRWRSANIKHGGYWMIDSERLQSMLRSASGEVVRLRLDSMYEEVTISSQAKDGTYYEERDDNHVQRFGGASVVDVTINHEYFTDAVKSCSSKLVRMEFEHDRNKQPLSPIVIRGEDEQFKAIVMPIAEEEKDAYP